MVSNIRSGFVKIGPIVENPDTIPIHTQSEPIPICTKPITKEEYLEYITQLRGEQEFDRLPFASWAYEEFPEFAEKPEQIAAINAQWTEDTLRAKEKNDLEAEKKALQTKISRLKQLAKKNRAIKTARRRLEDIAIRQEEMRVQDEQDIKINSA